MSQPSHLRITTLRIAGLLVLVSVACPVLIGIFPVLLSIVGGDSKSEHCFFPSEVPELRFAGGLETEFLFHFAFYGGQEGSLYRRLLVTTNRDRAEADMGFLSGNVSPVFPNDKPWAEVYVVSPDVALQMDEILEKADFFRWQSMRDVAATDGTSWSIVAKSDDRRLRTVVSPECGLTVTDYLEAERGRFDPGDSDVKRHAAKLFTLVQRVHSLAREKGELVRKN